MTIQEFDGLLRTGLAAAAQRDLESAWAAQGPAPACSAGYLAWQEQFLSDPVGTAGKAQRRASPLRRAARLALIAALAALLLVSCAFALVPGFRQYWSTQVTQLIGRQGGTAEHYRFQFDSGAFLFEALGEDGSEPAQFHNWYFEDLPKLPENRAYEVTRDENSGFLVCTVRSTVPGEEAYTFGEFSLIYRQLLPSEAYSFNISVASGGSQPRIEEARVGKSPAFLFYARADAEYPICLIWFHLERQVAFELRAYGETAGYTAEQLLEVAACVREGERVLPSRSSSHLDRPASGHFTGPEASISTLAGLSGEQALLAKEEVAAIRAQPELNTDLAQALESDEITLYDYGVREAEGYQVSAALYRFGAQDPPVTGTAVLTYTRPDGTHFKLYFTIMFAYNGVDAIPYQNKGAVYCDDPAVEFTAAPSAYSRDSAGLCALYWEYQLTDGAYTVSGERAYLVCTPQGELRSGEICFSDP